MGSVYSNVIPGWPEGARPGIWIRVKEAARDSGFASSTRAPE
jgi:hypothetical protein